MLPYGTAQQDSHSTRLGQDGPSCPTVLTRTLVHTHWHICCKAVIYAFRQH